MEKNYIANKKKKNKDTWNILLIISFTFIFFACNYYNLIY